MPFPTRRGGGGAGFILGPINNLFGATSGNAGAQPLTVLPASNRAAAESVRDAYFTANPSNLAQYDAEGNENLGILLYFLDGSQNRVQPQTRVGGEWRDNAAIVAIQGLPGSGTDFSNVSDNHIPAIGPGPNKTPFDSGMAVMPNGDLVTSASIQAGPGSIRIGPSFTMSNGVLAAALTLGDGTTALGLNVEYDNTGTAQPFYYKLGAEQVLNVNTTNTQAIADPFSFAYSTVGDNITTDFDVVPAAAGDLRVTFYLGTDNTGEIIFDETRTFESADIGQVRAFGVGNPYIFPQNTNLFVEFSGIQLRGGVAGPTDALAGQTTIYFVSRTQGYTETDLFTEDNINALERRSTSLVIDASNVANYQPFFMFEFTNETGIVDLDINDNVFDVGNTLIIKHWSNGANPGVGVRYQITNGRIDGESDMILGQDSSIIARKVADNQWRIVASHDQDTSAFREMVQDIVGGMVTGNTETNITVTYDDTIQEGTGKLNFSVPEVTDERIQDVIGAMVSGNTETGITVTYDDTDGKLNFVTSDANTVPTPSIHGFSIDIPSRVDLNTNLNVQHNVTFDVSNFAQLTALELLVTTGTNQTLTLPLSDGIQTQAVTLAGISTASQGTVTFQLQGTHAGGTITSNAVIINVRNLLAQEMTYVDFQADRLPANFTEAGATSEGFATPQTLAIPTFTGSMYVVIAQPQNEDDITSIIIGGLDQFGTFEKVSGTSTIGGVTYEFYYSRNTLLGSVVSGVQLTINRG